MVFSILKSAVNRIVGSDNLKPASIQDVVEETLRHHPDAEDGYLRKAYEYAARVRRVEGETDPARERHCLNTAYMLATNQLDLESIAASLLQDVIPANPSRRGGLLSRFGEEQAIILDGLARVRTIAFRGRGKNQPDNFRTLIEAISDDVRILIVTLANHCQSMRQLGPADNVARRQLSIEALDIFSPLASRIGMNPFKTELEELAFFYLEPEAYQEIEEQRGERERRNRKFMVETEASLRGLLQDRGIGADIHSRVKHHFSIYKKIRDKNRSIDGIYDYYAYRVLTGSVSDCYRIFGILHNHWRHIPGRIKDFIATPKNNLYQALHTTLISGDGTPFEVQIKTHMMHRLAEQGVTAHWTYRDGHLTSTGNQNVAADLAQLLAEQDIPDNAAFIEAIRGQLNTNDTIVFTPKSELKTLPKGSTALDFAYLIHTDLGHHASQAKVDGRLVPLRNPLPSGCIVEIVTDPDQSPSHEWLDFVKTNAARSRIRAWLRKAEKARALASGRAQLAEEMASFDTDLAAISEDLKESALQRLGLKTMEDLYAAIGFGRLTAARAVQPFLPRTAQETLVETPVESENGQVLVQGRREEQPITFARCCNPIPGDDIVGFIAKGNRISVHQRDCNNLRRICINPERLIDVSWNAESEEALFRAKLRVETADRPSMIAEITRPFADAAVNVLELNVRLDQDTAGKVFDFEFEVPSTAKLEGLIQSLSRIKGVHVVERV